MGQGCVNGVGASSAEASGNRGRKLSEGNVEMDEDENGIPLDFSDGILFERWIPGLARDCAADFS